MMILVLLACSGPTRWTEAAAIAPTLTKVDSDRDGAISAAEWAAMSFHAAPFETVDSDRSGEITEAELLAVFLATDPSTMTTPRAGEKPRAAKAKKSDTTTTTLSPLRARHERALTTRYVLLALAEEVAAMAPTAALPTHDELLDAADTGDLGTAECRAILARLEAASDAAGLEFPPSLRAVALATRPVTEALPPEVPFTGKPRVELGPDGQPVRGGAAGGR